MKREPPEQRFAAADMLQKLDCLAVLHGSFTLASLVGCKNCNRVMHVGQCVEQDSDESLQHHASAMGHAASWHIYGQPAYCNLPNKLLLCQVHAHTQAQYLPQQHCTCIVSSAAIPVVA